MSDSALRRLERAAASGDAEARRSLTLERIRRSSGHVLCGESVARLASRGAVETVAVCSLARNASSPRTITWGIAVLGLDELYDFATLAKATDLVNLATGSMVDISYATTPYSPADAPPLRAQLVENTPESRAGAANACRTCDGWGRLVAVGGLGSEACYECQGNGVQRYTFPPNTCMSCPGRAEYVLTWTRPGGGHEVRGACGSHGPGLLATHRSNGDDPRLFLLGEARRRAVPDAEQRPPG